LLSEHYGSGRSLIDLISGLQELHAAKVDLFLQQQAVDTTTPSLGLENTEVGRLTFYAASAPAGER
jgi:hypothetical protein